MATVPAPPPTTRPPTSRAGGSRNTSLEKTMPVLSLRPTLAIALATLSLLAGPVAAGVDDDLRLAAKLHKGGDTPAAVTIWQRWAGQGNVDAAYNLGVIHYHGDGVPQDYREALRWYRQAAGQGDKVAQFQIGLMFQNGEGVEADAAEAHRWFTAHLQHHLHHEHAPQLVAWRQQAALLIAERDRRETLVAARRDGAQVLAELQRRAGMGGERPLATAAAAGTTVLR